MANAEEIAVLKWFMCFKYSNIYIMQLMLPSESTDNTILDRAARRPDSFSTKFQFLYTKSSMNKTHKKYMW